jgi:hypothetical protein
VNYSLPEDIMDANFQMLYCCNYMKNTIQLSRQKKNMEEVTFIPVGR